MNGSEFKIWREKHGIARADIATAFDIKPSVIEDRETDHPEEEIPRLWKLALAAWAIGIRDWNGSDIVFVAAHAMFRRTKKNRSKQNLKILRPEPAADPLKLLRERERELAMQQANAIDLSEYGGF